MWLFGNKRKRFMRFVAENNITKVAELLTRDPGLAADDDASGSYPLVRAAGASLELAQLLIEHGADVNSVSKEDWAPIDSASYCGFTDVVKLLLEHGAAIKGRRDPLRVASMEGHADVAELLLKSGADAGSGEALYCASAKGHDQVVKLLVKNSTGLDTKHHDGGTPLHGAAVSGSIESANLLINAGADKNAKCDNGKTPLHWALIHKKFPLAIHLAKVGCDINMKDKNGQTPLHEAVKGWTMPNQDTLELHYKQTEAVKSLLDAGAQVDSRDDHNITPLILSVSNPLVNLGLMKLLLEHGANPQAVSNKGVSALSMVNAWLYNINGGSLVLSEPFKGSLISAGELLKKYGAK